VPRDKRALLLSAEHRTMLAQGGQIFRMIAGVDAAPQPMTDADITSLLNDPFAALLLRRGTFPATLQDVLGAFDALNGQPEGLPAQKSYLVGEGSQIPWSSQTAAVDRLLRLAVIRASQQGASAGNVDVLISTAAAGDPATDFLQIVGWDETNGVFNYYQRVEPATWVWAGNSTHALDPASRGQGCFDSHVNGSMVMKELKQPWNNWQSMNATIDAALAPADPLRQNALYTGRTGAEDLQATVVQPGIQRWNRARVSRAVASDHTITHVPWFLRQLLDTTTVNLVSSTRESQAITPTTTVDVPLTFFLNSDAFLNRLQLNPTITPPTVSGAFYQASLTQFDFSLTADGFRQPGDTFFAFLVPEPAFEDLDLVDQLLQAGLLSPRFVACALMVDFPNPVFSQRRAQLLRAIPDTLTLNAAHDNLSDQLAQAIVNASQTSPQDSPEREFAANWQLGATAWQAAIEQRLTAYMVAVTQHLTTQAGFFDYVRLAESRRREFRPRPLNEFSLLLPVTNTPADAPLLQMRADGSVVPK